MYNEENEFGSFYNGLRELLVNQRQIENIVEIEDAINYIKKKEESIAFYHDLKKQRAAEIEKAIKSDELKVDTIKEHIKTYMKSNDKKSMTFPGVGSLSLKKRQGTWKVNDEDALKEQLKEQGMLEEVIIREEKINKTKLNSLLTRFEKNNNVPTSVEREVESENVSITFKESDKDNDLASEQPVSKPLTVESFDYLTL